MHIEEIRKKAYDRGFKAQAPDVSGTALIRIIQRGGGKPACFRTDKRLSCQETCEWVRDCKKLVAAWRR